MPTPLVIASGNPHKVDEFRAILAPLAPAYTVLGLRDLEGAGLGPFEEPEETGETFERNAAIKALAYAEQTGRVCIADDSGLEIDALGGRPGVISSHYFNDGRTDGRAAGMGREERDRLNNERVLGGLAGVPFERRAARFVCVLAVAGAGAPSIPETDLAHRAPGGPGEARPLGAAGGAGKARPLVPEALSVKAGAPLGARGRADRRLPHLDIPGATYFVTFNVQTGAMEGAERQIVLDACRHWHAARAWIHAICVMPDHVHVLFRMCQQPDGQWPSVAWFMQSIKGFSARIINARRGTQGPLWQPDYHDYILWSNRQIRQKYEYIQLNPVRAGLCRRPGEYPFLWLQPDQRHLPCTGQPTGGGLGSPPPSARASSQDLEVGAGRIPRLLATFRATFEGRIGFAASGSPAPALVVPRGGNGFGYDPLFLVAPEFARTSAELSPAEKNATSHRARAGARLLAWLEGGNLERALGGGAGGEVNGPRPGPTPR